MVAFDKGFQTKQTLERFQCLPLYRFSFTPSYCTAKDLVYQRLCNYRHSPPCLSSKLSKLRSFTAYRTSKILFTFVNLQQRCYSFVSMLYVVSYQTDEKHFFTTWASPVILARMSTHISNKDFPGF